MARTVSAIVLVAMTALALATALGCTKKYFPPPTAALPPAILVTPDSVQTIFTANCTRCHSGPSASAGMDLSAGSSYANTVHVISSACQSLTRVEPFQPDNSCLVLRIEGAVAPRMPLGGASLSPANINTIRNWILHGAPGTEIPCEACAAIAMAGMH